MLQNVDHMYWNDKYAEGESVSIVQIACSLFNNILACWFCITSLHVNTVGFICSNLRKSWLQIAAKLLVV